MYQRLLNLLLSILKFCLAAESFFSMPSLTVCLASFHLSFDIYILSGLSFNNIYQQSGESKNPYFIRFCYLSKYSCHCIMNYNKNNKPIKNRQTPVKTNFRIFWIELFLATVDNINNLYALCSI